MVEKQHKNLIRDISRYCDILAGSNLSPQEYFIESYYTDTQGKPRPHYFLTKIGCDMVANKMTGEKGVLFTAAYTKKFEEMKQQLEQPTYSYMIDDPIERAQKWIEEQKQRERLEQENKILKPKATYADHVLQTSSLLSATEIAKDYGWGATTLNKVLNELGVQYKQAGSWHLYYKYQDKGYTGSKTHIIDEGTSKRHMYWTQKGRLFIYNLLKEQKGIVPIMEREVVN